jgi:hypothetical protein
VKVTLTVAGSDDLLNFFDLRLALIRSSDVACSLQKRRPRMGGLKHQGQEPQCSLAAIRGGVAFFPTDAGEILFRRLGGCLLLGVPAYFPKRTVRSRRAQGRC